MRILFKLNPYNQQRQREKVRWIYPIKLAMYATYLVDERHVVVWDGEDDGKFDRIVRDDSDIHVPFLDLPIADRRITQAEDPKWQNNGNFKFRPGTYTMAADSCWWGKCTFCVENGVETCTTRPVASMIEELDYCQIIGFREIFDDSGTFPDGKWLTEFCISKIHSRIASLPISCNMRLGADVDYAFMKRCGFRMLLYGVESANQMTLNRLRKGTKADEIIPELKRASQAGLEPHIAVMFGYPWESEKEELKTLSLVHYCLRKGYAKTAQASLYSVKGETAFDRGLVRRIYEVGFSPEFWINKFIGMRRWEDLTYLIRGIKEGVRRD